jgi:hypothetical protein
MFTKLLPMFSFSLFPSCESFYGDVIICTVQRRMVRQLMIGKEVVLA